jgi:hypothetical protein
MSTPIACPRCTSEMKVKNHAGDHYCVDCQEWFTPEYLAACDRCSDLQTVQTSLYRMKITPRPSMNDRTLIYILFDSKDIEYVDGVYMVSGLVKYSHLKCVKTAMAAWVRQDTFWMEAA